jgi:hypothetical protein
MIYDNNIKGMLTTWNAVLHYAQNVAVQPASNPHEVLLKLPLPQNAKTTITAPTMIRLFTSNPAILPGMGCTVTTEVVKILLTALQKDFSIALGPEVILQRFATEREDLKMSKNIVCIGSSILRQLIPFLQAAGYAVTDLTQPGWIATEDNINILIKKMSELKLEPGFSVILDLVGNCVYRYEQFDGTLALPFKEGGRYHFAGPVSLCTEENFKRIIKMLSPVLLSAQHAAKIVIPPLPRHLFSTCCSNTAHCTNFADEYYSEKILNGATRLRQVLKKETSAIGMSKKWVLDGVGAILGTPVGSNYGTNREIIPDLRPLIAKDGVHLEAKANANLSQALMCALENLRAGKSDDGTGTGTGSGSGTNPGISGMTGRGRDYFWRGFTSPVGDAVGRASKRDGRGASGSGSGLGGGPGPGPKRHQQHKHLHSPYGPGSFRGRAKKN